MAYPKYTSYKKPQKNPTSIPSFLPRISPKETVRISIRSGAIPAISRNGKRAVCKTKHIVINIPSIITLFNVTLLSVNP